MLTAVDERYLGALASIRVENRTADIVMAVQANGGTVCLPEVASGLRRWAGNVLQHVVLDHDTLQELPSPRRGAEIPCRGEVDGAAAQPVRMCDTVMGD